IDVGGVARVVRIELSEKFDVAVVVPDFELSTHKARSVLPEMYSRSDTIFNVQRAALLVAALITGTASAFPTALEDCVHQPYRASLVPGLEEVIRLRAPGLLGCVLSGAGPSILVFFERGCDSVCQLVCQIFALHGRKSEVIAARIARDGFSVEAQRTSTLLVK
ncbi:MAG: homoserine kinase, partial [Bryobacteraceae bacterium]|nr:homoserine kinase [Bryobacteraceae bacterium]